MYYVLYICNIHYTLYTIHTTTRKTASRLLSAICYLPYPTETYAYPKETHAHPKETHAHPKETHAHPKETHAHPKEIIGLLLWNVGRNQAHFFFTKIEK